MEKHGPAALPDSPPEEESIGSTRLTTWSTVPGRGLVRLALALALARHVSAHGVLAITVAVGGALVLGLTLAAGGIYDAVEEGDGVASFDRPVLAGSLGLRRPALDSALTCFTHLGGPAGMSVIAATVTALMIWRWRWRSRTPLLLMLVTVAGSLSMTLVGKAVVGRLRPPQIDAVPPYESSPSFPSGHALTAPPSPGWSPTCCCCTCSAGPDGCSPWCWPPPGRCPSASAGSFSATTG